MDILTKPHCLGMLRTNMNGNKVSCFKDTAALHFTLDPPPLPPFQPTIRLSSEPLSLPGHNLNESLNE